MMDTSSILSARKKFQIEEKLMNKVAANIFLYPRSEESNWKTFYGFSFILVLLTLTVLQLGLTFAFTGFNSLTDFSNVSPNLGLCLVTSAKYIILYSNKNFFNNFFDHYGKVFWESMPHNDPNINKILDTYLFSAKVVNRVLIYYSLPLILLVDALPYIIMMYENKILGKDLYHLYPFDGWYPFDKIEWYYAIYSWESLMTGIVVFIYMYSDMINLFIIVCICMELKILGYSIKNLISEKDIDGIKNAKDKTRVRGVIRLKLRDLVKRHNVLAGICKDLDNIIGITMFAIYTMGAALICLTAFTSTVADDSYQAIRCFCFFFSLTTDAFNHCLIGQIMSDHSVHLAHDIYESQWIYADQGTRKNLLILLMRVQRPLQLTASGFVPMTLNTFTSIIGTAYRFFNLLRTVYAP